MANKKISQLNAVDPAIGIGSVALFPIASGTGPGDFQTAKITALEIDNFVLNPMPVGPNILCPENAKKSQSISFTSILSNFLYFSKHSSHLYKFIVPSRYLTLLVGKCDLEVSL